MSRRWWEQDGIDLEGAKKRTEETTMRFEPEPEPEPEPDPEEEADVES